MRLEEKQHIGPWTIISRLGRGGNGEVWKAYHKDGTIAALKILIRPSHVSRQRFQSEIAIQRRLSGHPGVLPILSADVPDEPAADVLAWLATPIARNLKEVLAEAALEVTVTEMLAVADTLTDLADMGISHRDLKPDNLFHLDGRTVLGDFGLVDYPEKEAVTAPGKKLGPMYFLAPEMLTHPDTADGRKADVYSLAKVLWVLAGGHNFPPQGEIRIDVRSLLLSTFVAHPRAYQLDRLIEGATRTDPDNRPSMRAFAAELRAWLFPASASVCDGDLSDLARRIGAVIEPSSRTEQVHQSQLEEAEKMLEEVEQELTDLGQRIVAATQIEECFRRSTTILDHFGQFIRIGIAQTVWKDGLCMAVVSPGMKKAALWCGMAARLYDDGELYLIAAYQVQFAIEGMGIVLSEECPAERWSESWRIPFGSAQQINAMTELVNFLNLTLRPAMEHFTAILERIRQTS